MRILSIGLAAGLTAVMAQPVESQNVPPAPAISYADVADLALAAPFVAHVRVVDADLLDQSEAPNTAPGHRRFLIEANVVALIRGPEASPQRVIYMIDLPNDPRGRAARVRKRDELLVFATVAGNRPGEIRLVAPDAQLAFSPALAGQLREILREASAASAPPRITGIGRAFHVPGSLAGESETQIFLQTADGRPISLNVLRRPSEQPRWSVALGEIVDDAAAPPEPESLLWYRLACSLPSALPRRSLEEAGPDETRAIQADYRLILERLGACQRNRVRR
ncbi:MAG TPA: hypothetical protein VFO69_08880 [Allosphingosinicella sp.]|nr:hypothetical protein [Allosphingosinicella sp.]